MGTRRNDRIIAMNILYFIEICNISKYEVIINF